MINDSSVLFIKLNSAFTSQVPNGLPNERAASHHHVATAINEVGNGLHVNATTKFCD
jgi:hypothetical protein